MRNRKNNYLKTAGALALGAGLIGFVVAVPPALGTPANGGGDASVSLPSQDYEAFGLQVHEISLESQHDELVEFAASTAEQANEAASDAGFYPKQAASRVTLAEVTDGYADENGNPIEQYDQELSDEFAWILDYPGSTTVHAPMAAADKSEYFARMSEMFAENGSCVFSVVVRARDAKVVHAINTCVPLPEANQTELDQLKSKLESR